MPKENPPRRRSLSRGPPRSSRRRPKRGTSVWLVVPAESAARFGKRLGARRARGQAFRTSVVADRPSAVRQLAAASLTGAPADVLAERPVAGAAEVAGMANAVGDGLAAGRDVSEVAAADHVGAVALGRRGQALRSLQRGKAVLGAGRVHQTADGVAQDRLGGRAGGGGGVGDSPRPAQRRTRPGAAAEPTNGAMPFQAAAGAAHEAPPAAQRRPRSMTWTAPRGPRDPRASRARYAPTDVPELRAEPHSAVGRAMHPRVNERRGWMPKPQPPR
jgi:hypothetical protein